MLHCLISVSVSPICFVLMRPFESSATFPSKAHFQKSNVCICIIDYCSYFSPSWKKQNYSTIVYLTSNRLFFDAFAQCAMYSSFLILQQPCDIFLRQVLLLIYVTVVSYFLLTLPNRQSRNQRIILFVLLSQEFMREKDYVLIPSIFFLFFVIDLFNNVVR